MRINKFIAENSETSRRKADELIKEGRVSINGKISTDLGTQIDPEKDQVQVDNKTISTKHKKIYIALNKPQGYITTRQDEQNRQTVLDLVPKNKNLKPVGRLDKNTEGLLIMTNDGDFIHKLTHPKFQCEKEYHVITEGIVSIRDLKKLEKGIIIEHKKTAPAKIQNFKIQKNTTSLSITIHEGRNRQIRKMFAHIGTPVKYLQRIRIGHLQLSKIPKGKFKILTEEEINAY